VDRVNVTRHSRDRNSIEPYLEVGIDRAMNVGPCKRGRSKVRVRLALVATLAGWSLGGAPAHAALGAAPEAAGAGQARTQAAVRVVPGSHYSTHESTLLSGTVVREFVGADGVVFGVAWEGPTQPDLSQFLGSSYAAYLDAARQQHVARSRHLSIDRPDLVIEHHGRMRAFAGHAYLPQRLPASVSAAEIR
jgi:hypothetical protein